MGLGIFDESRVYQAARIVLPADAVALVPLVAVGTVDRRIDNLLAVNRDTIAHTVNVVTTIGGVLTVIGSVSVPAGQGYAGTKALDLLDGALPATQVGLNLISGNLLGVQLVVAVQATFDLTVFANGGWF
jgi:hypothetical protein